MKHDYGSVKGHCERKETWPTKKQILLLKLNWENALVNLSGLLAPARPYLTLCLFIIICVKYKVGLTNLVHLEGII